MTAQVSATGSDVVPSAARVNPLAALTAALLVALVLILTIDPVSAGVAVALELALFPFLGVGWRTFWRRTLAVWIAAPLAGVTIALYGQSSGRVYAEWLLVRISDGSLELALATVLRVMAIALPSVVLFIRVDATELADALAQLLRLPSRFVLGALGAFRLVGLFAEDWRSLQLARRARGVADQGRIRRFAGMAFALLVLSVRRGSKLATAMEARAFGAPGPRTWARVSRFGGRDWLVIAIGAAIAAVATASALALGTWSFVLDRG